MVRSSSLEEKVEPEILEWLLRTGGSNMNPTHINKLINTPGNPRQEEFCDLYHDKIESILGDELNLDERNRSSLLEYQRKKSAYTN